MAFRAFAPPNTQTFMQEGGGGAMQSQPDYGSEVKTNLKFIPVNFGKKSPVKHRQAWSEEEQARFLEGVTKYHRNWQKVTEHVGTKTAKQVRSHAQKYFLKYPDAAVAILLPPPRPCRHQTREAAVGAASSGSHYPVDARDVATAAAVLQAGSGAPNLQAPSIAAYHNFPAQQPSFQQHILQSQLPQLTPQQLSAAAAAQLQQAQQQAATNKLLPSAIVPSPQGRKMSPVPPLSWHILGSPAGSASGAGNGSANPGSNNNNRMFSPVTLMSAAPAASHSPPPTPRLSVTSLLSPETESIAIATVTPSTASASCPAASSLSPPSNSTPSSTSISSALAASLSTSSATQPGSFYTFPAAPSGAMQLAVAPTLSPSAYSSGSAAFMPSVPTSST